MKTKAVRRHYSIRGKATARKLRKINARGTTGKPGFRILVPPPGGWYDPQTGRVKGGDN